MARRPGNAWLRQWHSSRSLRADFEKFFTANANGRHETFVDELLATREWAIERARYRLTYAPKSGGAQVIETGRHVVRRRSLDGRWQIAWEIWNTDTPAE